MNIIWTWNNIFKFTPESFRNPHWNQRLDRDRCQSCKSAIDEPSSCQECRSNEPSQDHHNCFIFLISNPKKEKKQISKQTNKQNKTKESLIQCDIARINHDMFKSRNDLLVERNNRIPRASVVEVVRAQIPRKIGLRRNMNCLLKYFD